MFNLGQIAWDVFYLSSGGIANELDIFIICGNVFKEIDHRYQCFVNKVTVSPVVQCPQLKTRQNFYPPGGALCRPISSACQMTHPLFMQILHPMIFSLHSTSNDPLFSKFQHQISNFSTRFARNSKMLQIFR